jgi:general secretion pathway protein G
MKKRVVKVQPQRGGFTLLELLIVLAIIVVIAAMVVPNLIGQRDIAQVRATQTAITTVESQLKMYNANRGNYPAGGPDILVALTEPSEYLGRQEQPYLERPALDAWNQPLNYEWPNTKSETNKFKPAIWSNGPDGRNDDGGGDDINNWTITQPTQ